MEKELILTHVTYIREKLDDLCERVDQVTSSNQKVVERVAVLETTVAQFDTIPSKRSRSLWGAVGGFFGGLISGFLGGKIS